jgi:hypothetical protein
VIVLSNPSMKTLRATVASAIGFLALTLVKMLLADQFHDGFEVFLIGSVEII